MRVAHDRAEQEGRGRALRLSAMGRSARRRRQRRRPERAPRKPGGSDQGGKWDREAARYAGAGGGRDRNPRQRPSEGAKASSPRPRSQGFGNRQGGQTYASRQERPAATGKRRDSRSGRFGSDRASSKGNSGGPRAPRRDAPQSADRPAARNGQPARGRRQDDAFGRGSFEPGPRWGRPRALLVASRSRGRPGRRPSITPNLGLKAIGRETSVLFRRRPPTHERA